MLHDCLISNAKFVYATHKQSATTNQKFFFKCRLEDCLIRLSPWTAL